MHRKPVFLFSIFTRSGKGNVLRLRWNRIGFRKGTVPLFAKEMKRICDFYAEGDENCPDSSKRKKQICRRLQDSVRKSAETRILLIVAGMTPYMGIDSCPEWSSVE